MATGAVSDFFHSFSQSFVATIEQCSNCGNFGEGWCDETSVDDGSILLKVCRECKHSHGYDDSSDVEHLREIVQTELHARGLGKCSCGNEDMESFKLEGEQLICSRCGEANQPVIDEEECVECPKCRNRNPDRIHVYELDGQIVDIECLQCGFDHRHEKELIKDISQLYSGDHIAWFRPYAGYYHHAIVVSVDPQKSSKTPLQVIEYGSTGGCPKGRIQLRDVDVDKEPGNMYRYNYPALFDGWDAVVRASDRVGEEAYNFVRSNCEHFVRWCRTGVKSCEQVYTVKQRLNELGMSLYKYLTWAKIGTGIVKLGAKAAGPTLGDAAAEFASEGLEFLYKGGGCTGFCPVFEALGAVAIAAYETWNFYGDYKESKAKLEKNLITRHEYQNRNIRSAALCAGRGTGAFVGGLIGELIVPVPILGSILGAIIGGFVGKGIGHYIGTFATHTRDQKHV